MVGFPAGFFIPATFPHDPPSMQDTLIACLLVAFAPLGLAQVPAEQAPIEQGVLDKLQGGLALSLAAAAPGEWIPVSIVLREQAPAWLMSEARAMGDKAARREYVSLTLKEIAARTQEQILARLEQGQEAQHVGPRVTSLWIANAISAEVDEAMALELAAREDVAWIHQDRRLDEEVLVTLPASPAVGGSVECGVQLLRADDVWSTYGITGNGIVVGMIDTGVCPTHPGIVNKFWTNPGEILGNGLDDDNNGYVDDDNGWNFKSNSPNTADGQGHGSHTAGSVVGSGPGGGSQQVGTAPNARVMVLRILATFAGETSVWESMQYAVDNGADITSASLGWPHSASPDRAMWRMVCDNTIATGVVVIYAAGNEGCGGFDRVRTPGDVPSVITIGATTCTDAQAGFTSCGPVTWQNISPYNDYPPQPGLYKPTVSAPGVGTLSHSLCNGYIGASGTSMSTPVVAGVAAMLLEADPSLDQFGVRAILQSTSVDLGAIGMDNVFGAGRVDAFAAVTVALGNGGTFCAAKVNTCGALPKIYSTGVSSASNSSGFAVGGTNARPGQFGILAYTNMGVATPPLPFFGGNLCLQGPLRRGPVVAATGQSGSCNGNLSLDMNSFAQGLAGGSPAAFLSQPGTVVNCQWWARDNGEVYLTAGFEYTVGL